MRQPSLIFVLLLSRCVCAQEPLHPAPGVSLVHFAKIDEGVYVGSKPATEADFAYLESQHIKNILNVKFLPGLSGAEKKQARKHGMGFFSIPMNASFIAPSEKHVDQILLTLRDKREQPIYLHCYLGRDRTSLIAGLYGINFQGESRQRAWASMKHSGFKEVWYLRGLKKYFEKHSAPSPVLMKQ